MTAEQAIQAHRAAYKDPERLGDPVETLRGESNNEIVSCNVFD